MLNIQDPSFGKNKLLHEALLEACDVALYGAGAYAYVTASGVNMLMKDKVFEKFMSRGKYHLVVGMDDITNTKTLDSLTELQRKNKNHLLLNAYISADSGSTFHPKFSWFRTANGGVIVVGSGNMTAKGLRRNVEAFVIHEVTEEGIIEVEAMWNEWLSNSGTLLKKMTDTEVLERAELNSRRILTQTFSKKLKRPEKKEEIEVTIPVDEQDEIGAWSFDEKCKILIAEIPGGTNNRWSQANFDINTFRDYFDGLPGVNGIYRLIMRNVLWDGSLGETKIRPTVSVASRNYRIELANPEKRQYPAKGKPIGVFAKIAERTFMYMIVFPDQDGHDALYDLVCKHRSRADRLVRYQTTVAELQDVAPLLPILYYLT